MKKLSKVDFQKRVRAIARARKIFIPLLTKNINIAFELYQEVLAEQERTRFLTTMTGGKIQKSWLDQYERPACPKCKDPLYLRIIQEPAGLKNQKGWKICWECINPNCFYEDYSKKDVSDWVKELKKKN